MKNIYLLLFLIIFSTNLQAQIYPPNSTIEEIAQPNDVVMPEYLESYNDITTYTNMKRITEPDELYSSGYPSHDYAKTQPWNADATMYKFYSNAIYDAQTNEKLREIKNTVAIYKSTWSNTNPDLIFGFRTDGKIRTYTYSDEVLTTIFDLNETPTYRIVKFGFGEGNIDIQDKYVVLGANPNETEDLVFIVFDLQNKTVLTTKTLEGAWGDPNVYIETPKYIDWVSVSQSGDYVGVVWDNSQASSSNPFIDQNGDNHFGVEIYNTANLSFSQRIADYGNHGDFGFNPSGEEVYVQFWGENGTINSYHLANNTVDVISTHPDFGIGAVHISCRNYLRPGWAYVNTDLEHDGRVYAIKLDGSGIVENFGHTFANNSARPVPNPLGDKVMVTSKFGQFDGTDEQYEFELSAMKTYVPDNNLEQALIDLGLDTDLDDYVLTENISTLTYLDIDDKDISDLTGIQDFTALETLYCSNNNLTSLDLSANVNLKVMSCTSNQISSLNVESCTILEELYCRANQLTDIDVSKNVNLKYFGCQDNLLTGIDVSNNTSLQELYIYQNQILSIDISANTSLTSLNCFSNLIADLDLHLNSSLTSLICDNNELTNLDLSSNTNLSFLDCHSNQLTSLDLSENSSLISLQCNDNPNLESLNVQNGNNSNVFDFQANNNPKLKCIFVDDETATYLNDWLIDETAHFVETETECDALEVEDIFSKKSFEIYPNPSSDFFTFNIKEEVINVNLFNILGKLVSSFEVQDKYDILNLRKGIYIIEVKTEKNTYYTELVVE